jgi:hypothetical protein
MSSFPIRFRLWHLVLASFFLGLVLGKSVLLPRRNADTRRVEGCLQAYISLQGDQDNERFQQTLQALHVTPAEFQKIIDRFLHYRIRKSAMEQAMKLLQAFQSGYDIAPQSVSSQSDAEETGFELDAEILTVFQEKPELIQRAFGG